MYCYTAPYSCTFWSDDGRRPPRAPAAVQLAGADFCTAAPKMKAAHSAPTVPYFRCTAALGGLPSEAIHDKPLVNDSGVFGNALPPRKELRPLNASELAQPPSGAYIGRQAGGWVDGKGGGCCLCLCVCVWGGGEIKNSRQF